MGLGQLLCNGLDLPIRSQKGDLAFVFGFCSAAVDHTSSCRTQRTVVAAVKDVECR